MLLLKFSGINLNPRLSAWIYIASELENELNRIQIMHVHSGEDLSYNYNCKFHNYI